MPIRGSRSIRILICLLPVAVLVFTGTALFLWGDALSDLAKTVSPGCISRRWFHVYCPGCGGTRAFCALAKGEFLSAVKYNCWWIPTFFVLLAEYYDLVIRRFSPMEKTPRWKRFHGMLISGYAIFTAAYMIMRNIERF